MRSDLLASCLPHFSCGEVVKGFGRGSKELGIPTANFPVSVVENLPEAISTGIYFGWASVNRGPVYKMVMSIGWNPFYKNTKKSMETHIIHTFEEDFYGAELSVAIVGFIRPEKNYPSLEALIDAIHADIKEAEQSLDKPENHSVSTHSFFSKIDDDKANGCLTSPEQFQL
ncbi:PREDICTED: riboflavin kinase-like isoform X2 [Acropora digitifera]|uniref:riboflavin kinase-like isoform X2 n=1 Tax=Acropora digitifera TaxID=70779 RepID=UPI000779F5BE|nr:PREDICTED: riboflavin kinase-like isoform X2 [Acropora digitifera]